MILIADSGSTKTDWRLIDGDQNIHQAQTIGLNPYFVTDEQILSTLQNGPLKLFTAAEIRKVYFYGSGISNAQLTERMERVLKSHYRLAEVYVEHDLLGAARALCKDQPGIATILGTGMNSCAYDGEHIVAHVPSLGYVLGDEGSGAHLGKKWAKAYLSEKAPKALCEAFFKGYGVDRDLILERVYSVERPNRFLASFVPFLRENLGDPFVLKMVKEAFAIFFDDYILQYPQHKEWPLNLCGSIGYHFHHVLNIMAEERDITFGNVIQTPIAALTLYHLETK